MTESRTAEAGPGPRRPAYDAVYAYLAATTDVPRDLVTRNAIAWRAVHAALDAVGLPRPEKAAVRLEIDLNDRTHDGLVHAHLPAGITVQAGQQVTVFESEDGVAAPATVRTVALGQVLLDVDWNALHDDPPAKEDR